ncbi:MAG TPA: hypothetical protein VMV31_02010 [Terriglobales bacterium]|nr:hypothetical protein [Terriglobales bacterium]
MRRPLLLLTAVPLLAGFGAGVLIFFMVLALAPDALRLGLAAGLALLCGAGLLQLGRNWR